MAAPIGPKKVHRYTVEFKIQAFFEAWPCHRPRKTKRRLGTGYSKQYPEAVWSEEVRLKCAMPS